ncbi:hypothetical protein GCM10009830_38710 [Glycomyces endophyticus]|uniref:Uncharacterized protein n=2 Tax=Glycomyces endophyticus TaxID=480996 RepID=A0ABP4THN0_9ACTN
MRLVRFLLLLALPPALFSLALAVDEYSYFHWRVTVYTIYWVPVCAAVYALAAWRLRGAESFVARAGMTVTAWVLCIGQFAGLALSADLVFSSWAPLIVGTAAMAAASGLGTWIERPARAAHAVLTLGWASFSAAAVQGPNESAFLTLSLALLALGFVTTVAQYGMELAAARRTARDAVAERGA